MERGEVQGGPSLHFEGQRGAEGEPRSNPMEGVPRCRTPLLQVGAQAQGSGSRVSGTLLHDLRSALAFIRSDDRDLRVRMGMGLKELGTVGRGLWMEWSQTSPKFHPADAARVWDSPRNDSRITETLSSKGAIAERIAPNVANRCMRRNTASACCALQLGAQERTAELFLNFHQASLTARPSKIQALLALRAHSAVRWPASASK